MERFVYPELSEQLLRSVLPNGLQILVIPRPGFVKKLAYFVTDYGSLHNRFQVDGKEHTAPDGIAHFLEHKMFDMPGRDITEEFAALGAVPNAFTSYDMTAYYFSCTENFEENLALLLEYVSTPYFTAESVEKEQGIIGQEIGMHADNPDSAVFENLMDAMYRSHPIRVPILGTKQTIGKITPQVLELCHRAFYRPDNMLLCVIGDVSGERVEELARQYTCPAATETVQRQKQWPEEMTCPREYTQAQMDVAMPMFQLGFKCEPLDDGEEAVFQEMVGDLAAEALFGESSELYLRLYEQGVIDGSFGGGFETVEGMAMLTAYGDSDDPQQVRQAVLEQAQKLCREGIRQEDFLRMKRSAIGRRIRDLDSFDSVCFRACAYHFSGFDYFRFPQVCTRVEVADVLEFIQRVVTGERCSLSVILPREQE